MANIRREGAVFATVVVVQQIQNLSIYFDDILHRHIGQHLVVLRFVLSVGHVHSHKSAKCTLAQFMGRPNCIYCARIGTTAAVRIVCRIVAGNARFLSRVVGHRTEGRPYCPSGAGTNRLVGVLGRGTVGGRIGALITLL